MQRLARILPNGQVKRTLPAVSKDVADGIADLRDFTRDTTLGTTTAVAGEAISGLYRLYHLGETDKVKQSYAALHRLRQRNSESFGDDIPINHERVCKSFREVVVGLMCAVERDFDRELKQQLEGYAR